MTERKELILQMFAKDKSMSIERLCEKTGLSSTTAKREIAFLKKSGCLERIGSLKYFLFRLQKIYAVIHRVFPLTRNRQILSSERDFFLPVK